MTYRQQVQNHPSVLPLFHAWQRAVAERNRIELDCRYSVKSYNRAFSNARKAHEAYESAVQSIIVRKAS